MNIKNNHGAVGGAHLVPVAVRRRGPVLAIEWDATGHIGLFEARALRLACPCAGCVDEMSGRPLLDPDSVPSEVLADGIELVGSYGLKIRWSDGHSTGIYTFRFLRERCPCPDCVAAR